MKSTFVFLLLVLFGNLSVEALQCFSCVGSNSNILCNQNTVNCSSSNNFCMTTVTTFVGFHSISKTCSSSALCTASSLTNVSLGGVVGNQVTCCQTDLCNINASTVCGLSVLLCVACLLSGLVLSV
ncbi:lymphocyte antigen 6E [Esox lucius]|uniref:lymphocyte antigen 6E n=1 Tax=Esox lucius TaxID=8010 RepID=UPI0009733DF3|nr:lymphocyte antigen 6E [Esox lucius]